MTNKEIDELFSYVRRPFSHPKMQSEKFLSCVGHRLLTSPSASQTDFIIRYESDLLAVEVLLWVFTHGPIVSSVSVRCVQLYDRTHLRGSWNESSCWVVPMSKTATVPRKLRDVLHYDFRHEWGLHTIGYFGQLKQKITARLPEPAVHSPILLPPLTTEIQ